MDIKLDWTSAHTALIAVKKQIERLEIYAELYDELPDENKDDWLLRNGFTRATLQREIDLHKATFAAIHTGLKNAQPAQLAN